MAQVTYEHVVKLADQLTHAEQQALIAHLQERAQSGELTNQERIALFESITTDAEPGEGFSFRREDWYDDDGR